MGRLAANLKYQWHCAVHAATETFDRANSWAWLTGYAALWLILGALGYSMMEPNGPGGILFVGGLSLGTAWLLIFIWRFVFVSPHQLHLKATEKIEGLEGDVARLQNEIAELKAAHTREIAELTKNRPDFVGKLQTIYSGGYDAQHPNALPITVAMTISNVGSLACAITDEWKMVAENNGVSYRIKIVSVPNELTLAAPIGGEFTEVTYQSNQAIFIQAARPIQQGEMVQGYLHGMIEDAPEWIVNRQFILRVEFVDVMRNKYSMSHDLRSSEGYHELHVQPLARPVFKSIR